MNPPEVPTAGVLSAEKLKRETLVVNLLQKKKQQSYLDVNNSDKTFSRKNVTIKALPSPAHTVKFAEALHSLHTDLNLHGVFAHISYDLSNNVIEILIQEILKSVDNKCKWSNAMDPTVKQILLNDNAVRKVLLSLTHHSAGYQQLATVSVDDSPWAIDFYTDILILAGFRTSRTDGSLTPRVATELLTHFNTMKMNLQHTDPNESIYDNLDAYCAEKTKILQFLQANPSTTLQQFSAIQSLYEGLPKIFFDAMKTQLAVQSIFIKDYKEAVQYTLTFQNCHKYTFAKITESPQSMQLPANVNPLPSNLPSQNQNLVQPTPLATPQQPLVANAVNPYPNNGNRSNNYNQHVRGQFHRNNGRQNYNNRQFQNRQGGFVRNNNNVNHGNQRGNNNRGNDFRRQRFFNYGGRNNGNNGGNNHGGGNNNFGNNNNGGNNNGHNNGGYNNNQQGRRGNYNNKRQQQQMQQQQENSQNENPAKRLAAQNRIPFQNNDNIMNIGNVSIACATKPTNTASNKPVYFMDSASTLCHCTNGNMLSPIDYNIRTTVHTADGHQHQTCGAGYLENLQFHITPSFNFNLISVIELNRQGWKVEFENNVCTVMDRANNLEVFRCNLQANSSAFFISEDILIQSLEIYWQKRVDLQNLNKPSTFTLAVNHTHNAIEILDESSNTELSSLQVCGACNKQFMKNKEVLKSLNWHARLHKPLSVMKELVRLKLVTGLENLSFDAIDNHLPPCVYCIQAGMKCRSYSSNSNRQPTTRPFEVVHVDLKGPITPIGIDGEQYMLGIVDTYSKHTTIYFLKTKDTAWHYLATFIKTTVTEVSKIWRNNATTDTVLNINLVLGKVISDQGGEFTSASFAKVCSDHGVAHQLTPAYTPELNGQVETKWSSIMTGCRKWLLQSQLPTRYWPYAVKHEVYIQNRTNIVTRFSPIDHKDIKSVPYAIVFKKKPSISHIRQFGCQLHVFVHPEQRDNPNFSSRSYKGVLIGFNDIVVSHSAIILPDGEVNKIKPNVKYVDRDNVKYVELAVHSFNTVNGEEVISADNITDPQEDDATLTAAGLKVAKTNGNHDVFTAKAMATINKKLQNDAGKNDDIELADNVDFYEAMNGKDKHIWLKHILDELTSIEKNKVWTLIERPPNKRLLGTRWVLRVKLTDELLKKFKARLVVLGYQAIDGEDYLSLLIFAPVAKMASFRLFLSIVTQYLMFVVQADVDTAFQNANLQEDIYLKLPTLFEKLIDGNVLKRFRDPCLKLNRALYGLPQAPKAWFNTIDKTLRELGYVSLCNEPCLYKKVDSNGFLIALTVLYVDDLLIANTSQSELEIILSLLQETYKMKINRNPKRILGINISFNRLSGITTINQTDKIEDMQKLIDLNTYSARLPNCPLDQSVNWFKPNPKANDRKLTDTEATRYRTLLGKAMYVMTATRPDICFAVSLLSRANKEPTEKYMHGIIHVIKYLINTKHLSITFKRHHPTNYKLLAYSDADWATETVKRRSQTGGIILLAGTPIIWISTQQTTVALSSTEAEINALREITKQVLWTRNTMRELGVLQQQFVPILEDNTSAILLVHNPAVNNVNRHTDISHKFITENIIEFKTISVNYVPSSENIADLFTKIVKEPLSSKLIYYLFNMFLSPNGINIA